jgi:hypothetical protein
MKSLSFLAITLLFSFSSFSFENKDLERGVRLWKKITIPGAKCGNGEPYSIWFDEGKNNKKLTVELMGGGACWSKETCFGPNFKSWLFPIPRFPLMSLMSAKSKKISPSGDGSYLYFPYCTADVWAGKHTANYSFKKKTYHWGYRNLRQAFKYLKNKNMIPFSDVNELIIYGASAGALGSFLHGNFIAKQLPANVQKTIIADAPGLHFGDSFWDKFPTRFIDDINSSLNEVGLSVDLNSGNLSSQINTLCEGMSDWNIGVLQGSRDYFMSKVFGEISQDDHHALVFGQDGIWEHSKPYPHCSTWLKSSGHHTFLIFPYTWFWKAGGTSAKDFAFHLVDQKKDLSVRDIE